MPINKDKPTVMNSVKGTGSAKQNPSVRVIRTQNLSRGPALWAALHTYVTHMAQGGTATLEQVPKGFWRTSAPECLSNILGLLDGHLRAEALWNG